MSRVETIGNATLYLGNSIEIMPTLGKVKHVVSDPPYEASLHAAKVGLVGRKLRNDGVSELKGLDFDAVDDIRDDIVRLSADLCEGWFLAFCTVEGVAKWADCVNASSIKYKRACIWVKPDSTPQLNGQGPAQGAECFVVGWAGTGHAKWNAGGKRGVYTHCVNNAERTGLHPTEKPRRLMAEIIADFTSPGETILDPFMGSGTTGVAAVMLGRPFIGIEQNEAYFDLACRRLTDAQRQGSLFGEAA